jgi:hypothetical protein
MEDRSGAVKVGKGTPGGEEREAGADGEFAFGELKGFAAGAPSAGITGSASGAAPFMDVLLALGVDPALAPELEPVSELDPVLVVLDGIADCSRV